MGEPKTIDSHIEMSVQEALAKNASIGGSRTIEYGGLMIIVPLRDIEQAVMRLQKGNRQKIMASVNATLAREFPKVKAEKASLKEAVRCGQDITIWFANEVIEGRATLGVQ